MTTPSPDEGKRSDGDPPVENDDHCGHGGGGHRVRRLGGVSAGDDEVSEATELVRPLSVGPGQHRCACDVVARFAGKGVRLTILHNGHVLARIFTEEPSGAQIRDGRGDVALVAAEWISGDPFLHVLVEASGCTDGRLDAVRFSHQIDLESADH